ncbi:transglutaminase domain-containing protein [Polaribacter sp.]|uniref:transglutaminase domain-containing protein n=1 Tax=Polaribacter sp. TaxID=1920175 RepID=UPI003EF2D818
MKKLLLFTLLLSFSIQSQDFTKVDELVKTYPRYSKVELLASKIAQDFTSDEDKLRAAFFWLAKNIRYNLKEFYNPKQRSIQFSYTSEEEKNRKFQAAIDQMVSETFLTKQGVCEEYAQSLKKICDLLKIESEVIKGYVRYDINEIGKTATTTNHAWNGVKINGKWIVLDATWAAGYELNRKWIRKFDNYFYNIPRKNLFKTHFPEDSLWVLRFGRMSLDEFYQQPIYGLNILNTNINLLGNKNGILTVDTSKNIELQLENLNPKSVIYYTFKGMKYGKKPLITKDQKISTLKIQRPQKNSELIIFIDHKAALQFKTL